MRITVSIFVLSCIWCNLCCGQQSTISITSESVPLVLHINSATVNPTANTVAIGPISVGKNHVRLSFTKKGMPELNAQIECPNDGFYHQLSYRVVIASKGPNSLTLVSDLKIGQVVTQANQNDVGTGDKKSTQTNDPKTDNGNKKGAQGNRPGNSKTTVTDVNESNSSNQGQSGQVIINLNTSGMNGNNTPTTQTTTFSTQPATENVSKVPQVQAGLMCANASVNQQTFMQLKYRVSTVGWDMYKAKDSKEFMNKNCMLAAQVADLVKLVQAAEWQLDLAQFGYMHTFDQANYSLVVDALSTDMNKKKLLEFIGSGASPAPVSNTPPPTQTYTETATTNSYSTNSNTSTVKSSAGCTAMGEDDFQEALDAADEPIGENEKMEVAKSVFDDACLSTNQVLRVVELFIDESKKLDFAKFAFSRTSDKDKYFRINRAFINDQRIAELSAFVKQNK